MVKRSKRAILRPLPTSTEVKVPARLHVLFARDTSQALVIRRGPSKATCTAGWDRRDDTFTMGQWLRGRIYERRSDLSPDGQHFIYFAMNGRWRSPTRGSWSAISRAPYLKAVGLWAKGDCWHGGGLFLSSRSYWLNGMHFSVPASVDGLKQCSPPPPPPHGNNECLGVYFIRLLRDGWTLLGDDKPEVGTYIVRFEKKIDAHWTLRKIAVATLNKRKPGQGVYFDEHALVSARGGEVLSKLGWEWADVDESRKRIVWAERGCLYAAKLKAGGMQEPELLYDFTPMNFEAIAAPY
ncbi:MAG: hypothetical protein JO348_15915 [Alphaproteobacteria bacterium]|nr:hypothetical protein [Alphaproteobacteria bacterium]MBV9540576.1 hypothetical protein [Alphaproteobacteria bacterium]